MLFVSTVAATALRSEKVEFTTPPNRFTTGQRSCPSSPGHFCGALYCTITLTVPDGLANSACRSGEILELFANKLPEAAKRSPTQATRATNLLMT
jgi:hypothetical protein